MSAKTIVHSNATYFATMYTTSHSWRRRTVQLGKMISSTWTSRVVDAPRKVKIIEKLTIFPYVDKWACVHVIG
jgi:hypothetical protein